MGSFTVLLQARGGSSADPARCLFSALGQAEWEQDGLAGLGTGWRGHNSAGLGPRTELQSAPRTHVSMEPEPVTGTCGQWIVALPSAPHCHFPVILTPAPASHLDTAPHPPAALSHPPG